MIIKLLSPLKERLHISDIKTQPWISLAITSPTTTDKSDPEKSVT